MDNSSNPSSSPGIAPFCWAVVATGPHGEWVADTCETEAEADSVLASRGAGYSGAAYRKEAMHLGSSLARLQEERNADTKIIDRLAGLGIVIHQMIGGGFCFENEEGDCDSRRHETWRQAALAGIRYFTEEDDAQPDAIDLGIGVQRD